MLTSKSQIQHTRSNTRSQKLLGLVFGNKLKFDKHIENICHKANRKLNALARVTNNMELPKRRILTLPAPIPNEEKK